MKKLLVLRTVLMVFVVALLAAVVIFSLNGCTDADVASENLSKAADQFEIQRRVVFFNGITDTYLLSIEGRCSIYVDKESGQLEVTVKTGPNEYKKHFLGLSDNVTYFVEQLEGASVSTYRYRVIFKPSVIVPNVDVEMP
jgi:FlaG/FlaF family flagellin (archaellin)